MSPPATDSLHAQVEARLSPHGSSGLRTQLASVVDLEALREKRYEAVLATVNDRLSTAYYSLISMLVAGIYFGILVGAWLVDLSSWFAVVRWTIPTALVTLYAIYATHQTLREIYHLAEARALLERLVDRTPSAK